MWSIHQFYVVNSVFILCSIITMLHDCPSKEGLDCNNFIADIMVVLPELYMSSMFESSTCSIHSS